LKFCLNLRYPLSSPFLSFFFFVIVDAVHDIWSVRIETIVSKLSKYYHSHWAGMIQLLSEERYILLPTKRRMVAILGDILKYLMSLD
jgi:hypothetical protein